MRSSLLAAAVATLMGAATVAHADQLPRQSCIAVGDGYQRVAATVAQPGDCCTGRLQCSQFLSTTRVVRPAREQHT